MCAGRCAQGHSVPLLLPPLQRPRGPLRSAPWLPRARPWRPRARPWLPPWLPRALPLAAAAWQYPWGTGRLLSCEPLSGLVVLLLSWEPLSGLVVLLLSCERLSGLVVLLPSCAPLGGLVVALLGCAPLGGVSWHPTKLRSSSRSSPHVEHLAPHPSASAFPLQSGNQRAAERLEQRAGPPAIVGPIVPYTAVAVSRPCRPSALGRTSSGLRARTFFCSVGLNGRSPRLASPRVVAHVSVATSVNRH